MKLYDAALNATNLQVETGTAYLKFDIEKTQGYDTVGAFFGYGKDKNDKLEVRITSPNYGGKNLVPLMPIFPLMVMAGTGPNNMKAYKDAQGKIYRVTGNVIIGHNGALKLNAGFNLNVETNIQNLKNLRIYAIDSNRAGLANIYDSTFLNPLSEKVIDLLDARLVCMSKSIRTVQLTTKDSYTVNLSEPEVSDISNGIDDLSIEIGKEVTEDGVVTSFVADQTMTGGNYYSCLGVTDYFNAKITSDKSDYVYTSRLIQVDAIA